MTSIGIRRRRKFYLAMAWVQVALFAGVTYGWTNLKECLQRDGVYKDDPKGNSKYILIFSLGSWFNMAGRLVLGVILDKFGVKVTTSISCLIFVIGGLMLAVSNIPEGDVDLLLPGFILVSAGGPGLQLATQLVADLFDNRGMVISSLTWAFNVSTGPYLLLNELTKHSVLKSRQPFFYVHAGLAGLFGVINLFFWPKTFRESFVPLLKKEEKNSTAGHRSSLLNPALGYDANFVATASLRKMLCSRMWIELMIWLCCFIAVLQFYIGTIGDQTKELVGENMSQYFGILVVVCSFSAVFLGYVLDKLGFTIVVFINTCLCVAFCMILTVDNEELQYAGFVIYVTARVTSFSMFFSFVAMNFGFRHFGKLAAIGMVISGLASFIQIPMATAVDNYWNGDYRPIMRLQGYSIGGIGIVCTIRMWYLEREAVKTDVMVQAES